MINDDRIASLDALGFEWKLNTPKKKRVTKSFEQRLADLQAYKEKNGHINVNVKGSKDKSLYQFCWNMRQARKTPEKSVRALTDDRIASLSALGFEWNRNRKSFAQRIEDLQAYKEKHGHVNVKKKDDKSLNEFCIQMRYARNNPEKSDRNLTEIRIASLDALGFGWRMR